MYTSSNRATVNGNTPPTQTAAQVLQQNRLQQHRIQSFLTDDDGPNTMLAQASTSAEESMAKHRAQASRKIDDIVSKVKG
ncbi:hypothetical protein CORC01_07014 [Colletotrichum orchidophilum]|uniref:Uncharacterized protein n=1 Tax=Colletotrichum orchidophilum TaxID=1209926 RepID=A0A1G4B827_9PEZI|nr:uncharacterized protein CORC01_07014 [Colletotrichum orchidophilum]OHE97599.1 hypothetical protein CORC01_07014 [Colletotrichum orchidophilum]